MKRICTLFVMACSVNSYLFAQTDTKGTKTNPVPTHSSKYIKPIKFYVSKPLRDLPLARAVKKSDIKEVPDKLSEQNESITHKPYPRSFVNDPVRQRVAGFQALSTPLVNFDASPLSNGFCPPDPDGAVGLNEYVEVDNCNMAVYDKSGNVIMAPRQIGWLWDSNNLGDPVVLYDKFADRWFVSQLEFNWTTLDVAVSVTNDPTGAYYVWYYNIGYLPDYPKYSIWPDGYYNTYQNFSTAEAVNVLERNKMLAGDPNAGLIMDTIPYYEQYIGANRIALSPKTLDCDGAMPPYGTPNFLFFFANVNSGSGLYDQIMIYKLATDTTAKTLTITKYDSIAVAPFDAYFTGSSQSDISQPGLPNTLDALDGTFNFRVPYMRFTGYGSVLLCNTVNLGDLVAGVRWYELRLNDTTLKWSLYQQGTYGPNDSISRWNASICMDDNGDIAMAYTVSDPVSLYPSIRYTGRMAGDPPGQMTFAEQTAVVGTSAQTNSGRWGDYSCTTLDPADGITFWHTNEYMGNSGIQHTRVFSFKMNQPFGITTLPQTPEAALRAYQSDNMLNIIVSAIPGNNDVNIALFDINGKQLTSEWLKPQSGMVQTKINIGNLPLATYLVRVGNMKFQTVKKVILK